jgi:hypothetical protein
LHRRVSHLWLTLLAGFAALVVSLTSTPAAAAPKDAQAEKLYSQAMDEDYLNTKFDDANKKLKKALKACGSKGCSDEVVGKLNVGIGVVYGGGKNDMKSAKKYFAAAFEADGDAKPLEFYMTPQLKKVFDEIADEAGDDDDDDGDDDDDDDGDDDDDDGDDDDDDDDGAGGDLDWTAPSEALVDYPLPIFVKVPADLNASTVKVKFKAFGGTEWGSLKMRKMKGGFGGVVPCSEVTTTGDLKLYVLVKDNEGDSVATAGTRKRPMVVKIKNAIEDDQPALPGEDPPKKCTTSSDCPPGFPGCTPSGGSKGGEKGWGASCEDSDECRSGLICLNGFCEEGEGDDDDDDDDGEIPKNIFTLGVQFDLLSIGSADNVCGVSDGANAGYEQSLTNYFCFYDDGTGEYLGKPSDGDFNQVQGGLGFAGARILAGYDRIVWKGLAVGGRIGFAFGGSPGVGDAEGRFGECNDEAAEGDNCHESLASNFLPFHGEIRASYFFPDPKGFMDGLIRPYGFLGGGLGQVNAGVPVAVCDYVDDDGYTPSGGTGDGRCPAGTQKRENIKAYQITGLNFIDFGIGSIFAFHPMFGLNVEAKFMVMLPTVGFVIAPVISPVFMF